MNALRHTAAALVLSAIAIAPVQAQDEFQPAQLREVEPLTLASFNLPNGNEVRFYGVPEDGELMIGEIADAGREVFSIDTEASPAEIFARLAPADLPVPSMIAATDKDGLLAYREQVEALPEPVDADADDLLGTQLYARSGSGSCASGSAGADYFESHHCYTLGGPGYGSSEPHCYEGSWNSLQKTSDSKRRATYTRMASCGSDMNRLRHYYSTASGYTTQVNVYVDPQKVISWWSYKTGIKRYRRVRMEEVGAGGWIRGWIKYHSEVAGGW